jgi:hypothetical protein
MKQAVKGFVRWFSELMVLDRSMIALVGAGSLDSSLRLRIDHFLGPTKIDVIVARGFLLKRERRSSTFIVSSFSLWRLVAAFLTCKVAFLEEGRVSRAVQTLMPRKCFAVNWTGNFRNSSWRWLELGAPSRGGLKASSRKPLTNSPFRRNDSVIVLGTGPSSSLIFSKGSKDFDIIACNTAVKCSDLFSSRHVVAHCFSDATFMLGVSEYSAAFMRCLKERAKESQFSIVHDAYFTTHLKSQLDRKLTDRLMPIFLDPCNQKRSNFRTEANQYSYTNVLTALMLPLAATWYDKIFLLGFDGKGKTENYFWKHQDLFQFTELLPTVRECDPGFFAGVDYDAYSAEHERYLSEMLDEVKQLGVVVRSLTRSSSACIDELFDYDISLRLQEGYRKDT